MEQNNCLLSPVNSQTFERQTVGGSFKPLTVGVVCYTAIDDWNMENRLREDKSR